MKISPLALLTVFLLACGHTQIHQVPNKPVEKATTLDCLNVYQCIMTITVDKLQDQSKFTQRQREEAEWELEQEWIKSGSKARFLASCEAHMTVSQVDCMLHVERVEDMHTCAILFR